MSRQGFAVAHSETSLPDARLITAPGLDPALIDNLSAQEWREALRACKSMGFASGSTNLHLPLVIALGGLLTLGWQNRGTASSSSVQTS